LVSVGFQMSYLSLLEGSNKEPREVLASIGLLAMVQLLARQAIDKALTEAIYFYDTTCIVNGTNQIGFKIIATRLRAPGKAERAPDAH
jgi:hypothetical protein